MERGWVNHLSPFFKSEEFIKLQEDLKGKPHYPLKEDIFKAFRLTPWEDVKVIPIAQDPYSGKINVGNNKQVPQATGLCFGIPENGLRIPPSLENIKLEIEKEYDELLLGDFDYTLESWAKQGVLLLNTALTVKPNTPASYIDIWKPFTNFVVKTLSEEKTDLIWLLWGSYAKNYNKLINTKFHHVLESGYPSPLSANRGFWFGNGHFKKTNEIIESMNSKSEIIKWYE